MLVIRLLRVGKKNQPSFKIVVVQKTESSTSGKFIEEVGFYNPLTKEKVLKQDRIKHWISVGAKPLETVHNLLISEKIIEGKKIDLHKKAKVKEGGAPIEGVKPAEAQVAQEAVKEEVKETAPVEEKKEEVAPEAPAEEKPVAEEVKLEEVKAEVTPEAKAEEVKTEIVVEDKPAEPSTESVPAEEKPQV